MHSPKRVRRFGNVNHALTLAWFSTVVFGLYVLLRYETKAQEFVPVKKGWPTESQLNLNSRKPTGIMFIHPHCPCTNASVSEMNRLIGICHEMADFNIVVLDKEELDQKWRNSSLVQSVKRTPGVSVFWDKRGLEAKNFDVQTSGHFLLYNVKGDLVFTGGITGSRGHEGENSGTSQLRNWLRNNFHQRQNRSELLTAPVFGCLIFDNSGSSTSD